MAAASFSLFISYSQVAVFDSALEHPFNLWTERHVKQGFSWRPGSVSFATLEEAGQHDVEIDVVPDDVALSPGAVRIVQTPFNVPQSGSIEIASISESIPLSLSCGSYLRRFEYFLATAGLKPRIRFVFIRNEIAAFRIMRADPELTAGDDLLLSAEPA
jgi:Competence protein J (ComJ)